MVQIDVVYEGGLRTRATHGPSGQSLVTDAPVDNHGKGESFSPTDLVATAAASCMLSIMAIVADRHGWPFEGARARVTKVMVADPARRIGALELSIEVPGKWPEDRRVALQKAALACPVYATLAGNVDMPTSFEWEV
jgi:putative redox protein